MISSILVILLHEMSWMILMNLFVNMRSVFLSFENDKSMIKFIDNIYNNSSIDMRYAWLREDLFNDFDIW